ncbi:tyrosine-type recombinase/integrase [Methylocella silvestris]|uniref:Integrase n=1 Tax=Methylocella silvestris TaxID=199596 RepID=A0A2J7TLQ6_METSI|nr:site-specific integrase [Methylocella silvestris]PNG27657.1 integrase [Methylocella silvestris]
MATNIKRLNSRSIQTIAKPGRHADGNGLYLQVDQSGARRWIFLFRYRTKPKEMGLGGLASVGLSRARELAAEARAMVADGLNPIEARRTERAEEKALVTFGAFADELVESLTPSFRNEKHKYQWSRTLEVYAAPIRSKAIDSIQTDDVLSVLTPIWTTKNETASRLRGRIERVLDAAKARGLRSGENPARWRGHLDALLPARQKLSTGHLAAMPYADVPAFMTRLREREAMAALALEFAILTAARTNETLGAKWSEVDLDVAIWTVPADRMKAGREHRVPLSDAALEILAKAQKARRGNFVFPGQQFGEPLSNMALSMLLRRLKIENATVHGFRSSFRDWAFEETETPREIAEAALAHIVGSEVERAYRRGDALKKRRVLMEKWADFCSRP